VVPKPHGVSRGFCRRRPNQSAGRMDRWGRRTDRIQGRQMGKPQPNGRSRLGSRYRAPPSGKCDESAANQPIGNQFLKDDDFAMIQKNRNRFCGRVAHRQHTEPGAVELLIREKSPASKSQHPDSCAGPFALKRASQLRRPTETAYCRMLSQ
jgi:hypothetical protein